jgi:hypothetical protein
MRVKRLAACMLGGVTGACICVGGGFVLGKVSTISTLVLAGSIFNRLMIGFVIGISQLKINYILHGALIGLLVSLVSSIGFINDVSTFALYTGAGMFYGILTEIIATNVFKTKTAE